MPVRVIRGSPKSVPPAVAGGFFPNITHPLPQVVLTFNRASIRLLFVLLNFTDHVFQGREVVSIQLVNHRAKLDLN